MTNVFQVSYDNRLRSWYDLRMQLESADMQTKCCAIDAWWQHAPLVNHYLHPSDTKNWPGPWELLADNTYCTVARGLGMCYTLAALGTSEIDFCQGIDDNNEDVMLVLVDHAKYILNYYPNTVLSNTLHDFKISSKMNLANCFTHII